MSDFHAGIGKIENKGSCQMKRTKKTVIFFFLFVAFGTTGLKGSDVSTTSNCSIASSFGLFTHRTGAGEFLTPIHQRPGRQNVVPEFVKLGIDPLEVTEIRELAATCFTN